MILAENRAGNNMIRVSHPIFVLYALIPQKRRGPLMNDRLMDRLVHAHTAFLRGIRFRQAGEISQLSLSLTFPQYPGFIVYRAIFFGESFL